MRSMRNIILGAAMLMMAAPVAAPAAAASRKTVESGKTQIVAKLNNREITISDLRNEMARLGLSPNAENSERVALENIVNRALLVDAARDAKLNRQPEALRRMAVAQEQALADLYLATASQPPEPTPTEIENFISSNPSLFSKRRIYSFSVLSLPTENFDQEKLSPLFDEAADFTALAKALDDEKIAYSIAPAVQPSNAFPEAIRKQLAQYSERDNIVIQGDATTQIMKITDVKSAPTPDKDASAIARQALLQQSARDRAKSLLESLKGKSTISYYRETAAPAEEKK